MRVSEPVEDDTYSSHSDTGSDESDASSSTSGSDQEQASQKQTRLVLQLAQP